MNKIIVLDDFDIDIFNQYFYNFTHHLLNRSLR